MDPADREAGRKARSLFGRALREVRRRRGPLEPAPGPLARPSASAVTVADAVSAAAAAGALSRVTHAIAIVGGRTVAASSFIDRYAASAGAARARRPVPRWALVAAVLAAVLAAIALVPTARRLFAPPPPAGAAVSRVVFPAELAGRGRVTGTIRPAPVAVATPSPSPTASATQAATATPTASAVPSPASTGGTGAGEAGGVPGGVVGGTGSAVPSTSPTLAPTAAPTPAPTPQPTPVATVTPAPNEDVIEFTILDLNTRAPIAGVCVVVGTGECTGVRSYYTDAKGHWSFAVPRRTTVYDFRFYKTGYTPKPYQFTHVAGRDPDQTTVFMH